MAKILVIEDEAPLRKMTRDLLVAENHQVDTASDGLEGEALIQHGQYDLALIDWNLPEKSGIDVCKSYRQRGGGSRILMLTGKSASLDKIMGLDAGADDYLTKPFDPAELLARVRALLRRPLGINENDCIRLGDLAINVAAHEVTRGGRSIALVKREFALLLFLAQNPDRAFTTDALIARIYPNDADGTPEALFTTISRLRKKIDIGGHESAIATIHGVGYKLNVAALNAHREE